jgi:hypothetical protein
MEKPKNYQEGGQKSLNKATRDNIVPILLLLTIGTWVISSIWVTVEDIFNGYEHTVLSTSFIISIITIMTGITLGYVRKNGVKILSIKTKKPKEPCKKCGKNNKTKK